MANVNLFGSTRGPLSKATDSTNEAGGKSYALDDRHALAQLAGTGCLNRTFYADAETQLKNVLELAAKLPTEFIAKTAVFAREQGYMKDMPALLTALLAARKDPLLKKVFKRVITNGKMLRNFVQIVRSGVTGRKSFGTAPKRLLREWFENRSENEIFLNSIGANPSLADVIKMVHPKPNTPGKDALYGWLINGKSNTADFDATKLPQLVKDFQAFIRKETSTPPAVPFEMLTSGELTKENWCEIARNARWQWTRMNLNTMVRHGVFDNGEMVDLIATRLADRGEIQKAHVFPYQLLAAYQNASTDIPRKIRDALQDAMEISTQNVPPFEGTIYVGVDVSGSMNSPITGFRQGSTSKVTCVQVAALIASVFLRRSENVQIIPFSDRVKDINLNAKDSIMTNAQLVASKLGGGTACSAPVAMLNGKKAKGDLVVIVSDNMSWRDAYGTGHETRLMAEWASFRARNKNAKMVCVDLQPYTTTQAYEREDIMNIGGWSDSSFRIINQFAKGELDAKHWVSEIEKVDLDKVEEKSENQKK